MEPDLYIAGLVDLQLTQPGEFLVSSLSDPLDVHHGSTQAVYALPQVLGAHEVARRYPLDRDDLLGERLASRGKSLHGPQHEWVVLEPPAPDEGGLGRGVARHRSGDPHDDIPPIFIPQEDQEQEE